jgi:putative DNA methylase
MPTRKLIEVALPLDDINAASAREKSIRHGHPSTLHLWWARRPLAACRAVLFASLIDDPDQESVPAELLSEIDALPAPELPDWQELPLAEQRRQRLFRFIKLLVQWESSNDERVLATARRLIQAATGGDPPPIYDPFAGGGSIPLEAQRLGLEAHASDLNPVAVLINKALIEIPPKFAGMPPVNPVDRNQIGAEWKGAAGLAADVRHYGKWMRDEAEKRIGHLYPKVQLPREHGGGEATVIAWLWARTVTCPNPACGATMPLVRSFALSTKKGKESWVEPVVEPGAPPRVRFEVRSGAGKPPEGTVGRKGARCVCCGAPVSLDYVRAEGRAGHMGAQMLAIVAEGKKGRIYLPPSQEHERVAATAQPAWAPETELPEQALGFRVQNYGLTRHADLFTPRQLVALTSMLELLEEVRQLIEVDIKRENFKNRMASAYADAISTYLGFAIDRGAESWCSLARWQSTGDKVAGAYSRQALSMLWDYADANPFSNSTRNFMDAVEWVAEAVDECPSVGKGTVWQQDAAAASETQATILISTDPPYYDNVPYADLSDFFYVWLRASLKSVYPELMGTLLVPKAAELVAEPFRHGGREAAQRFFEEGLLKVFRRIRAAQSADYPLTVYYAFKQAENDDDDDESANGVSSSTGWETMLEGLIQSGFAINGTWPMRTEREARTRNIGSNALATSIVLVCRPRPEDARSTTRLEFIRALRRELPTALRALQRANIAPVDLAQAAIGPGMAIYSRYKAVLEADGTAMRVRPALQLINAALDEVLAEQEGAYDADTRWAIAWFEQSAFDEGQFGVAETLSKAKNTSVAGMVEAGVIVARGGKVRLIARDELPANWNPAKDERITAWEATQQLVRALDKSGESGAAAILAALPGSVADQARDLAYRLYTTCERKKWAQEALAYNSLVIAWPEIAKLAVQRVEDGGPVQRGLDI